MLPLLPLETVVADVAPLLLQERAGLGCESALPTVGVGCTIPYYSSQGVKSTTVSLGTRAFTRKGSTAEFLLQLTQKNGTKSGRVSSERWDSVL